jgi:hypothetical protein
MNLRIPTLTSLCFFAQYLEAQTPSRVLDFNRHAWVSYSGDHAVSGRWGIHFDAQWRRSELGTHWQQYQLRPGLNYSFSRNTLFTLGYAFTKNYPYGEFPVRRSFPEHRVYQQLLVRQRLSGVRIQHRARLEQRFIKYPDPQPRSWTYQNRFRYLLRAELPLNRNWYIPIYDEILIGIPPNYGARPFDQNRLFAGIGRSVGKVNVDVGYLNQFLGQRNGRIFEFNSTLFIAITSSAPFPRFR